MGIWIVSSGDIRCDTCKTVIGKLEYDKNDGDFLEKRVKVTCLNCLKPTLVSLEHEERVLDLLKSQDSSCKSSLSSKDNNSTVAQLKQQKSECRVTWHSWLLRLLHLGGMKP